MRPCRQFCDGACRQSFREDRLCGLVYGAAHFARCLAERLCVYCGAGLDSQARRRGCGAAGHGAAVTVAAALAQEHARCRCGWTGPAQGLQEKPLGNKRVHACPRCGAHRERFVLFTRGDGTRELAWKSVLSYFRPRPVQPVEPADLDDPKEARAGETGPLPG